MVSACGGGSSGSSSDGSLTTEAKSAVAVQSTKEIDAGRLAKQATFGATPDLIAHIASVGSSAWLDEQFALSSSTYKDLAVAPVRNQCNANPIDVPCYYRWFNRQNVAMRFYSNTIGQPDQLRQRVALALSEFVVASTDPITDAAGVAAYNQIFLDNAFGNYRDILLQVTMLGFMGDYLNMSGSSHVAPSENYAREFLQLFSMGPNKLNMDGSLVTDSTGAAIPNYTAADIAGAAKALTGWTIYKQPDNSNDYTKQMTQVAGFYDTGAKTFLGVTVPAGVSEATSVAAVIDAAFNNASTPPYVAKRMIQQLVTSNPTPAYVARVAAVFVNNGNSVRGDMKAVVRAVLMDSEARIAPSSTNVGKVKEPILLMTSIARASGMKSTDGVVFINRDKTLGQMIMQSPSVFNFYPPDFPLPQSTTLFSPVSKLFTTVTITSRDNMVYDWTVNYATSAKGEFQPISTVMGSTGTTIDWSGWEALGTDIAAMVDRIDLIMMNRTMTTAQRTALTAAAASVINADPATQARMRAQALIYIVGTSPLFQVDR
ncbi:DUF1800 family protein [Sphingomonas nostoxanthinifaciens]|uniref:DUF1800 family protein n=1 Tax=Sphingomonas nostoxanthinifaciens TaxID=2872652 RepID=UPI001CC1EA66|nr:DUF1800 family protein [Sphingomonas nostoxanthinifaciens]UAK24245.1 DUF1800 domain-containing protein [Sphingomonas nostoxanthinifaciens]